MYENENGNAKAQSGQTINVRAIFDEARQQTSVSPNDSREVYARFAGMTSRTCEVLEARKRELQEELKYITNQLDKFDAVCDLMLKTIENESNN